ncbi:MAG: hypothetical protein Q8S09_12070 [Hyphomonas sp.]|nr:hypothetical protein [Hyphomonas sp.]
MSALRTIRNGLGTCLLLLPFTTCASARNVELAEASYERSRTALEMPMRAQGYSDVGDFTCSYSGKIIYYNGNTSLQLVNCLLEAPEDSSKLVITSSGGDADVAIFAAHVMSEMVLDVEVVGWCASSCANYILPAARRIYLDQHSLVAVHGAPGPPDRERLIEALGRAGLTDSSPKFETTVSDNLKRAALSYQLHNNFRKKFRVGEYYYYLDDIAAARETEGIADSGDMYLVDPFWLRRCLPGVEIVAEAPNRKGLQELLPMYTFVAFSDVRGPDDSCFY